MNPSPIGVVAETLLAVGHSTGGHIEGRLRDICARAGDPPVVAVAGRVSSGKSTLVNALVGRRVARTDAGECTQVVARYRYGRGEQVVVHGRDGATRTLPLLSDGGLPDVLGMPIPEIDHVEVFVSIGRLRSVELIDSPGVSSGSDAGSRAGAFLGFDDASRDAVGRADGVIYMLSHTGRTDEVADLKAFGSSAGGRADAAIGVLGKSDLVADGDPLASAALAADLAGRLVDRVRTVVPMWTLVAETLACGRFREPDAATVDAIACLDEATRSVLLADATLFHSFDVGIPSQNRRRLHDLLGSVGARTAIHAAIDGARGAAPLSERLQLRSGHDRLEAEVASLGRRADVLRAARMLSDAEKLGHDDRTAGGPLRDAVERLRAHPALHVLDEVVALDDLDAGRAWLPPVAEAEARTLLNGGSVGDPDDAIDRWREIEVASGDPVTVRLAQTVARTLYLTREATR